jgi:hypothetical protein
MPIVYNHEWMPFHRPIPKSSQPKSQNPGGFKTLVEAEKLMQIAVLLPSSAFIGWIAGVWMDHVLHRSWIPLAGILFGGFSGLFYVVRLGMPSSVKSSSSDESKTDGDKP